MSYNNIPMKSIAIQSIDDFMERATSPEGKQRIFRGNSSKSHDLIPTVGRIQKFAKLSLKEMTVQERYLLYRFHNLGAKLFPPVLSEWQLLFTARNHGLPVRLLDWSTDPRIALFFAVSIRDKETAVVYSEKLNSILNLKKSTDPFRLKKVARINSPQLTNRNISQSTTYTIHPDSRLVYRSPSLIRYTISAPLKAIIYLQLRQMGIHEESVLGGLDVIAKQVASFLLSKPTPDPKYDYP